MLTCKMCPGIYSERAYVHGIVNGLHVYGQMLI